MSDVTVRDGIEIERIRLDQLNLDLVTARTHGDRNVETIAASLRDDDHPNFIGVVYKACRGG